jgi:hypothetical protein
MRQHEMQAQQEVQRVHRHAQQAGEKNQQEELAGSIRRMTQGNLQQQHRGQRSSSDAEYAGKIQRNHRKCIAAVTTGLGLC